MCTVTIIPKGGNDFVLTSNRDEAPNRISLPPDFYMNEDINLLFPMDKRSGGTWIGLSEKNRVVCVLNGAFSVHERKEDYSKSRGIIALDFLTSENILTAVETYSLTNIEPFTMIIVDWNSTLKFYELVWDGVKKHFKELPLEPKIWSSSTLYTTEMKLERQQWFEAFRDDHILNAQSLLAFHKKTKPENKDYGVIMNRGFVKTTSITQIEKFGDSLEMYHENLQNKTISSKTFQLPTAVND
ncbi:NRDE family protein [Mariniflexile gromovii]|uniref:NRDE family protein n=1 Tax=Mariniflexile gromovii TaxID=362523 RepID=A0ABS4BZJ2_9FLAO|nr:NRDE family protein [Mariniflexile gromovii]MBP0905531.1 NRDE family protein [Mariniflexile gromovii]